MADFRTEQTGESFWRRHGGIALGGAVLVVILMVILPASPLALDILLAVNLFAAFLLLLLVLSARAPLELSSFPTLMLLSGLFRLALCIAAARLIVGGAWGGALIEMIGSLADTGVRTGAGGPAAAMSVALVLAIVYLVVISAGTGRAAEVAARFSLDALPGKQLAVDSALAAGSLDDAEAQARRRRLQAEAEFYAAMDGASRFARGEAIACVAMIALCLVGGVATGLAAAGAGGLGQVWARQAQLCAGLAVVILVPGLLTCVSAALLVTKGSEALAPGEDVIAQARIRPNALWVAVIVLVVLAAAAPFFGVGATGVLPLLIVAAAAVVWALWAPRRRSRALMLAEPGTSAATPTTEQHLTSPASGIEIRLGFGLVGLIPVDGPGGLLQEASSIRSRIANEISVAMPCVLVRDSEQLHPSEYAVTIRGQELARERLMFSKLLAVPKGPHALASGTHPRPRWIDPAQAAQWQAAEFTVLTPCAALLRHFELTLRRHAAALIDRQSARALIETVRATRPAVVAELEARHVSLGTVRATVADIVDEGLPISDPVGLLEGIVDAAEERGTISEEGGQAAYFAEAVRRRLIPTITASCRSPDGRVYVLTLGPNAEQSIADAAAHTVAALAPAAVEALRAHIERRQNRLNVPGARLCVVCSPAARRPLRAALREACPGVYVISWEELLPDAQIERLGSVDVPRGSSSLPQGDADAASTQ